MSLGFEGPIKTLTEYALTHTYRIQSAQRNAIRCRCKGCGCTLEKEHGFQVYIVTRVVSRPVPYYFCAECFAPVKAAWDRWPLATREPGWWRDLDKPLPVERTLTRRQPLPDDELDRIIEERERKLKPSPS